MSDRPIRIAGNRQWHEFATTRQEAVEHGARLDAMKRFGKTFSRRNPIIQEDAR